MPKSIYPFISPVIMADHILEMAGLGKLCYYSFILHIKYIIRIAIY